jgi:cellulose synthase/poly-beta-1,6-N-acetylglucosamine synthase-like glycosyltransferase
MNAMVLSVILLTGACLVFAMFLGAWTERLRNAQFRRSTAGFVDQRTRVTCVVPARNAEATLVPLLQDMHAQVWPKDLTEVVVVDDASEDGTGKVVRGMQRTWPELKLATNAGVGKKAAITTAVDMALGEIIVLTDADARTGPLRTKLIVERMDEEQLDLLILPVHTKAGRGVLGRLQEEEQAGLLGMAAGEALLGRPMLANGANMAFRRSAFRSVGGYQGDRYASGDDVLLVQRMRNAGKRIGFLLDARAVVVVQAELTWKGVLAQRIRWAGKMRAQQGPGPWVGLLGLLLPWVLLWRTATLRMNDIPEDHGLEVVTLLALAWLAWLVPVLVLVREVRSFLGLARAWTISAAAYLAFCLYSPIIAVLAIFVRPRWKGRRI